MDDTPNKFAALIEAADRTTENWIPQDPGDLVAGTVLETGTIESSFGLAPTVTLLTEDDRELRAAGFGAVLGRALASPLIEPGDLLVIKYVSDETTVSGAIYKLFKVVHRGPDGKPKTRKTGVEDGNRQTPGPSSDSETTPDMTMNDGAEAPDDAHLLF